LVHVVELISVEPIGRPEERKEKDNVYIGLEGDEKTFEF